MTIKDYLDKVCIPLEKGDDIMKVKRELTQEERDRSDRFLDIFMGVMGFLLIFGVIVGIAFHHMEKANKAMDDYAARVEQQKDVRVEILEVRGWK